MKCCVKAESGRKVVAVGFVVCLFFVLFLLLLFLFVWLFVCFCLVVCFCCFSMTLSSSSASDVHGAISYQGKLLPLF